MVEKSRSESIRMAVELVLRERCATSWPVLVEAVREQWNHNVPTPAEIALAIGEWERVDSGIDDAGKKIVWIKPASREKLAMNPYPPGHPRAESDWQGVLAGAGRADGARRIGAKETKAGPGHTCSPVDDVSCEGCSTERDLRAANETLTKRIASLQNGITELGRSSLSAHAHADALDAECARLRREVDSLRSENLRLSAVAALVGAHWWAAAEDLALGIAEPAHIAMGIRKVVDRRAVKDAERVALEKLDSLAIDRLRTVLQEAA